MPRVLGAVGAVAVAVVLFIVLRPGSEADDGPPLAQPDVAAPTTDSTTTEEATTIPPKPRHPSRLVLEVRDGRVAGGVRRPSFSVGDRVVIVVRSDVEDDVHVHGYDLVRHVAPDKPARIVFRPRFSGGFEVELEDRHLLLAELRVQP